MLNTRISELELEEKQLKAEIYKNQFELTRKEEEKINLTQFKKQLISFRTDYESINTDELKVRTISLVDEIVYHPNKLTVQFKSLPWKEEFTT